MRLGCANNMRPLSWGGGHKRKRSVKSYMIRVFPIIVPPENIALHYCIFTMIRGGGGGLGYLTTKLGGGYNGKDLMILA